MLRAVEERHLYTLDRRPRDLITFYFSAVPLSVNLAEGK